MALRLFKGEPQVELTANTEDAAVEKHVPAVTVDGERCSDEDAVAGRGPESCIRAGWGSSCSSLRTLQSARSLEERTLDQKG